MKLLTNLFYSAKKKMQGVKDGENETFRDSLNSIVASKDSLSEEEISTKVDELKSTCSLLPDSEGKTLLERYLEDFKVVKNQDEETAQKAVETIANLFERLDSKASEEPTTEPAKDEGETVEEKKEETSEKSTDSNETKDEGKFSQEDLEQIWQFVKQKLEEETATTEGEGKSESEEVEEEKDVVEDDGKDAEKTSEEIAQDHAPRITIKMTKDNAHRGGLYEMFEKIKQGDRR